MAVNFYSFSFIHLIWIDGLFNVNVSVLSFLTRSPDHFSEQVKNCTDLYHLYRMSYFTVMLKEKGNMSFILDWANEACFRTVRIFFYFALWLYFHGNKAHFSKNSHYHNVSGFLVFRGFYYNHNYYQMWFLCHFLSL